MSSSLEVAPVLSTPDDHILEATDPLVTPRTADQVSDEELRITYDIERTIRDIKQGRWRRIALQFPDEMLPDAPRVFQLLSRGLESVDLPSQSNGHKAAENEHSCACGKSGHRIAKATDLDDVTQSIANDLNVHEPRGGQKPKLYILGDTSYGTCCVDEVAAEHVSADVVIHYGRACLSPTARLPVIHIFTHRQLDHDPILAAFEETYPNKDEKVLIVADVTFADHVELITSRLVQEKGYTNTFPTGLIHDPSSPVPNRTVPESVRENLESLKDWQLFHISTPPTALLLTLSSRVASIRIYPTDQESSVPNQAPKPLLASTAATLRRRYAILTSLSTVPIFGILINTLSVKHYLHMVEHVQKQIAAAGKKSYLFVVGKLNAAKVANFSEIGGWVVIGCWESSLVDSTDFWKPVITPYELEVALQKDTERVWTGEWRSDYQVLLDAAKGGKGDQSDGCPTETAGPDSQTDYETRNDEDDSFSDPESAPPEFDLRTGKYVSVSSTRPMQSSYAPVHTRTRGPVEAGVSKVLAKRVNGDLATIAGVVSPGAQYLRSNRTWSGLGSDFTIRYEEDDRVTERGSAVVEGRSGIARGYTVGEDLGRR
ncbi:diphthamide biosynthesis protein 2 [Coccidioides immitis RS]|uniref:2-(3-amino-3-carboxypropyl)histidine synthase subunit 2 n=1 Tax=Coccidioides immitis (strain RS) TaxID=246410 RepID=J3K4K1_COCIM|nr:diphthamide biosynthesis protein 2 [Coccidioides immitis RS]EAS29250.3 diphthamide biosynthesis protein 2 [Coccidioides immitis RS]